MPSDTDRPTDRTGLIDDHETHKNLNQLKCLVIREFLLVLFLLHFCRWVPSHAFTRCVSLTIDCAENEMENREHRNCVSFFPVFVVVVVDGFRRVFAGVGFIVIWWCSSCGGPLQLVRLFDSIGDAFFSLFTKDSDSDSYEFCFLFLSTSTRCLITLNVILEHWFSLHAQSMSVHRYFRTHEHCGAFFGMQ